MMMTKFEKSDLCIRLADKMDRMERSRERFLNSLIMILFTKARNMSRERIAITKFVVSFVYYLVLAMTAFLLTRDDSSKVDWPIDMEVPEYKKHMLEALTVFLFSLIGFKNFYFDFSSKNLWVIISVLFYLTMLVFGLFYKQIFDFLNYENDV